jgi:hypothetical protein
VRGASLVAERVWDLAALAKARREGRLAEVFADSPADPAGRTGSAIAAAVPPLLHGIAVAPTRKVWHASGGSAGR